MDRRKQPPVLIAGLPAHRSLRSSLAFSAGTGRPLEAEIVLQILEHGDVREQPLTSREVAAMVDVFATHFPSIDAACQVIAEITQKDLDAVLQDHKRYGSRAEQLNPLRREREGIERRRTAELGFHGAAADSSIELRRIAMAILAAALVQGPDGPGISMKLPALPSEKDTTAKSVPSN